jgi:hypothetical protein
MSTPFSNRTPESYFAGLRRKDSKNALTTCHGVTDKGRACRRALASPKNSSRFDGAVVITDNVEDPAIFFCWQHKDQADTFDKGDEGSVVSIKGRHSLEDAFRSLGLDDVDEEPEPGSKEPSPSPLLAPIPEPSVTVANDHYPAPSHPQHTPRPAGYPYERHRRRRSEHERGSYVQNGVEKPRRRRSEVQRPEPSKRSFSLFACCFGAEPSSRSIGRAKAEREHYPAARPVQTDQQRSYRTDHTRPQMTGRPARPSYQQMPAQNSPKTPVEVRRKEVSSHRKNDSGVAMAIDKDRYDSRRASDSSPRLYPRLDVPSQSRSGFKVLHDTSPTPAPRRAYQQAGDPKSDSLLSVPDRIPFKARSKSSPDSQQLQRIHGEWPPSLPRNTTDAMRLTYAKLLTAMSEQPSKTDSPGYIYIFWQTDVEQTDDETSAVASIISAPKLDRGLQRQETILQRRFFQTAANARLPETEKRTIFLKIGRAVNVHQRLNQWKKQCEYEISLLRSYPYESKGKGVVKQVPNVVKVERLIHLHLEMLGQRVSKQCRCGTEHKEWFEVGATANAVREVDEIVRRWTRWSEEKFQ